MNLRGQAEPPGVGQRLEAWKVRIRSRGSDTEYIEHWQTDTEKDIHTYIDLRTDIICMRAIESIFLYPIQNVL